MAASEPDLYPNLDFLRAWAVLAVVVFHLLLFLQVQVPGPLNFHSFGHWGVLMFFVHTSLVLNLSLDRLSLKAAGNGVYWPFMLQRAFRIYPLSIAVVVLTVAAHLPVQEIRHGQIFGQELSAGAILANLFLVQNLSGSESAEVPLWSLPYEMQMYLVLPLLFVVARRARSALPLLLIWLVGLIAVARPWFFKRHGIPDIVAYLPLFVPGVIAYRLASRTAARLPAPLWPLALAFITAIFLLDPSAMRGAICCLLLGLAIPQFKQISQPLLRKAAQLVSQYSYSIYLMHFICLWWAFQALQGVAAANRWIAFIVSLVVASWVGYHLIEAPMIRLGRRGAAYLLSRQTTSTAAPNGAPVGSGLRDSAG
jgi:peptidoglycan/LPS O-acetylase OafA/YrhL